MTPQEFRDSPTHGIDVDALGGSTEAENNAILKPVLLAATSWVNGKIGVESLQADERTDTFETRLSRRGEIVIYPRVVPVVSVTTIKYRVLPSHSWTTVDTSNIDRYKNRVVVRGIGTFGLNPSVGNLLIEAFDYRTPTDMDRLSRIPITVEFTYKAGYPITTLASNANAGATSVVITDATGVTAGQKLTIVDRYETEIVEVASDYESGTTIPLASALAYAHSAGDRVTAIPDAVRQATMLIAASLIRQAGSTSVTMEGTPSVIGGTTLDPSDMKIAEALLNDYRRVVPV